MSQIENTDWVNGLDPNAPLGSDPIAQGDDHIRLIKETLVNTFPNIGGEVTLSHDDLNLLSGGDRIPESPSQDGSMLYSAGGIWVETGAIFIDDNNLSVTVGADINISGDMSVSGTADVGVLSVSGNADVGSLSIAGVPLGDYTEVTAGEGIDVTDGVVSLSGSYNGTFTATDVVATSDERKKDQITTAPSEVIAAIQGREWLWKETGEKGSGVIAQELEAAGLEHLVHTNDDGMKSVSYNGLFAYVIEELKALRAAYERDCK
jgi:hypothetical protein